MLAARDKTCVKLDLLYYLLRKDPALQWKDEDEDKHRNKT
jgi:hypothetical protein